MSILEKTIGLLKTFPENKIEAVYAFVRFIDSENYKIPLAPMPVLKNEVQSMLGIAYEYAIPALIKQEEGAFERALSHTKP